MLRRIIITAIVLFGVEIAGTILAVCVYDPLALEHGWDTVSWAVLSMATQSPALAAVVSGEVCLVVGILLGHLFFGQKMPADK